MLVGVVALLSFGSPRLTIGTCGIEQAADGKLDSSCEIRGANSLEGRLSRNGTVHVGDAQQVTMDVNAAGEFTVHNNRQDFNLMTIGAAGQFKIGDTTNTWKLSVRGEGAAAGHTAQFSSDNAVTYVAVTAARGTSSQKGMYLSMNDQGVFYLHEPGVGDRIRFPVGGGIEFPDGTTQTTAAVSGRRLAADMATDDVNEIKDLRAEVATLKTQLALLEETVRNLKR